MARIRELGMTLAINPEVNHRHDPSETFDTWKAAALKVYPEIAHRYRPEMFAVIHEPTTMTSRLMPRIVPRETKDYVQAVTEAIGPQKWAEFAAAAVGRIKAASPKTRCAAGVLYYERPFLREFLTIKRLDAISLDIYGLSRLRTYDQMIEAARRAGKTVYIEESWRETYTDPMWAKFKNITPRPGGDAVFESNRLEVAGDHRAIHRARGLEAVTACGVTCMQTLFYYSTDGHGGNLDPVYMRHVVEAVNGGQRTEDVRDAQAADGPLLDQLLQGRGERAVGPGVEEHEADQLRPAMLCEKLDGRAQRDAGRLVHRKAIRPGAQGRQGDAAAAVLDGQFEAAAIGARQQFGLAALAAAPHRPTAWITCLASSRPAVEMTAEPVGQPSG